MNGRLIPTVPGTEADALRALADDGLTALDAGGVILVGERLAPSPARSPPRSSWPRPPAPGSPGCRAGPVTAARSRPAACRPCCPAAARPPTPSARVDAATAWGVDSLPDRPRPRRRRDRRRAGQGRPRWPRHRRRRPRRHQRPGRHPRRDRGGAVRGQPRAATDRRGRPRRRRAPGRAGRRQGRHLRHLGGPPASLRGGLQHARPRCPTCASSPASPTSSARRSASARVDEVRAEMEAIGPWDGARPALDARQGAQEAQAQGRRARAVDLEAAARPRLHAGRRRPPRGHGPPGRRPDQPGGVRRSLRDARGRGAAPSLTGDRGSVTLPVEVADLPDGVVWVPANSFGSGVLADLASPGSSVTVKGADMTQ